MCFNLILLQQNVINNWITISVSIMSVGNAISTRARFVYAAPETHAWYFHAGNIFMNEIHLPYGALDLRGDKNR